MEFVKLTREHIIDIYPRVRGDMVGVPLPTLISKIQLVASCGIAYAATVDGNVVFLVGIYLQGAGVGQTWGLGTNEVPKHIKDLTKGLLKLKEEVIEELDLHRMQTEVLADKPSWVKWAKIFGLEEEGVMRQYSQDRKDCVLMSWVRKD